ncbi:hypothetical protein ACFPVY_16655 [Flavobacterium qiangtangense]|uniref:SprB-like repeat protein n=1 Tax=Flavobacterium qiangtangense TaxID=1442595 RepID=A0ABW1PTA3_9FLAO
MKQFLPSVLFVCFVVFGINAAAHYNKLIGNHASGSSESKEFAKKSGGKKTNEKAAALAMTISLTKTDETCPNNGTINATVSGEEAGANVIFEYWNNATPGNVITSTMPLQGLGDGTYTVKAIATGVNVEEVQSEITIVSNYSPLIANSTIKKVLCEGGSDGQITVNVTQGNPSGNYQILSAPATYSNPLPFSQTSNVFTGLTAGVYEIRIYDACGLYNTITATVAVQTFANQYTVGFRPNTTDCSRVSLLHRFFTQNNEGMLKFPIIIANTIEEVSTGNIIYSGSETFTGTHVPGTEGYVPQSVTLTNPNYTYPLRIVTTVTDACGHIYNSTRNIRNNINLTALCAPEVGFSWDIYTTSGIILSDRFPNAVWPVTISWVNVSNPADSGSETTPTGTTPVRGTITGVTLGETYDVTITDACGKVRASTITIDGTPTNVGQTAFVQVRPSCATDMWIPYFGTASGGNNLMIDTITVVSSPAGSGVANGTNLGGGAGFNLWNFETRPLIKGEWVFAVKMGCVEQIITFVAPGHGVELIDATITPSNTCNSANVSINWSFIRDGLPIPWPTGVYNQNSARISLRDVTLPSGAESTFAYQNSNTFLNVPNGTYDVLVNLPKETPTQCLNLVIGQVTISNVGPQITSPYGFVCQTGNPNTPFGVIVEATGVGVLEYAITGYNGTPITPVWQTTNQFNSLGQGVYNIEIRDNCASTSTIFSTYSIRQPRITPNNLCPGSNGSLIVTSVPGYVYQWSLNGVPLTNGGHISGVDTNELTFTPFTVPADEGTYSVHVTYQTCVDDIYEIEISGVIPNAGDDITSSACYTNPVIGLNLDTFLSATAMPNGEWTQTSTNGGTLVDNIFDPNGIDPATGPFIFKYRVNGYCGSFDEAVITINFNETVAPTGAAAQNFCSADAPTIADLEVTGTDIAWYATQTASDPLAQTTPLVSGTTYYATQTVAG